MATIYEFTDPFLGTYRPVPLVADGICEICHWTVNPGYEQCWSCEQAMIGVSRPIELVVPISVYRVGEQLHTVLRNYKDSEPGPVQDRLRAQVASMVARFLLLHRPCIVEAAGDLDWQAITTVPSSRPDRPPPHPLEQVLGLVSELRQAHIRTLARGLDPIDHNRPSDRGYEVIADIRERRLLLLDDTYTSGARLQSAASALQRAGATVVAAVVVGRVVKPEFSDASRQLWNTVCASPFSFDVCCLDSHGE